jgi:DNA-binding CsgD family transcriptional regulator
VYIKRYFGRDKSAVLWREWLGLVCAFLWFFGSMFNNYDPLFAGIWTELLFMLLLCAGLLVSAVLGGRYSKRLEGALPYITLAGAVCTGLIPFLPVYAAKAVFWLSALMMTPLLCRRMYGTLRCAKDTTRIRVYIAAVSATIVLHMGWTLLPLSPAVRFPLLSIVALLGLWRVQSHLPAHDRAPLPQPAAARTPAQLARIAAIFLLLVLLGQFNALVHTFVVTESMESGDLFSMVTWLIAPASFLFFAYLSDKNRERLGVAIGITLIFAGCFAALTPAHSILMAPLLLSGEFGGTITEFCFLTMPLIFFPFSKRPLLVAVSSLIAHTLLASATAWTQALWLPQAFFADSLGRPLIIFGAVCALLLIPLTFSLWRRQKDATLMGALLGLKKQSETAAPPDEPAKPAESIPPETSDQSWIHALDLLEGEHRVVQLLCEGLSRAEIAERLGLSQAKVAVHLHNIRAKLASKQPLGYAPEIVKLAGQYGLTGRETEVLNELMLGRSNAEIAANLHIEETTVKTHVGKVLKKVGACNRSELISVLHR